MIKLYSWSTPNGRKISILLEEWKVKYKIIPINWSGRTKGMSKFKIRELGAKY